MVSLSAGARCTGSNFNFVSCVFIGYYSLVKPGDDFSENIVNITHTKFFHDKDT
jgi:hypothetical protein